jgi:uncharacterized membrane protein HdeD (DUF308 family)
VKAALLIGVGAVAAIFGIIFALQGVGVIGGSFMSGTSLWSVLGPLIALAGIAMITAGLWRRRTARRRP